MTHLSEKVRFGEPQLELSESPFLYELLAGEASFAHEGAPAPPFVPTPVENPGGGRVTVKKDPAKADIVQVKSRGGGELPLHRLAAQALGAMQNAARHAGIRAPLLLPTSGYRSSARQAKLFAAALVRYDNDPVEAAKWVAPPGRSAHQSGRAVDLHLGTPNGKRYVAEQRKTAAYRWLVENAQKFGFYPYEREPWHWEYNPPASGKVSESGPALPEPAAPRVPRAPTAPVSVGTPPLLAREDTVGPGKTLYVKIDLKVPTNAPWTGIFVPEGVAPSSKVDVVFYLHGHRESRVDRYWIRKRDQPLPLREALVASQKRAVLVVPTLGPKSEAGSLVKAGALDAFLAQVMKALGAYAFASPAPSLGQLVLCAHSGGGRYMAALALGRDAALQNLRECWAFDAFYGASAVSQWAEWARRSPDKRLISHAATDLKQTETKKVPGPLTVSRTLRAKRLSNVELYEQRDGHYGAVRAHFEERLRRAAFLANR